MSPYMIKRIVGMVTVVATVVLVFMVAMVIGQSIELNKLNNQSKLLDAQIERLMATKTELTDGIEYRASDTYIEEQARENLGMIKDGEVVYIFG